MINRRNLVLSQTVLTLIRDRGILTVFLGEGGVNSDVSVIIDKDLEVTLFSSLFSNSEKSEELEFLAFESLEVTLDIFFTEVFRYFIFEPGVLGRV